MRSQVNVGHLPITIEVDIRALERVVRMRCSVFIVYRVMVGFYIRLKHVPVFAVWREDVGAELSAASR